jgi:hypothetical protein
MKCSADFVALQYCDYIAYASRQIQRIAWGVAASLLGTTVALYSYGLQSPLIVGRFVALTFLVVGVTVVVVFAKMERNPILSRIAGSKPGELNAAFWLQILALGILPANRCVRSSVPVRRKLFVVLGGTEPGGPKVAGVEELS